MPKQSQLKDSGKLGPGMTTLPHFLAGDGSIGGVFSAITETTERVLGERRLRILRELAAQTAESKSVETACEAFARVLGAGNPDLPFAILYLLDEDGTFASAC